MIADATGGTLFLDEIGDLPNEAQAALSGFLADREKPAGVPQRAQSADVRIVAATQFDLSDLVDHKRFRRDLLDQLAEAELSLPALRERREDIPALFTRTVEEFNATSAIPASLHLRPETLTRLSAYDWPGNIREFRNVLASALMWTHNEILMPEDIEFDIVPMPDAVPTEGASGGVVEPSPVELTTRDLADGLFTLLENAAQGEIRYKQFKALASCSQRKDFCRSARKAQSR
jgi:DNA-binding NtrC family response regulator